MTSAASAIGLFGYSPTHRMSARDRASRRFQDDEQRWRDWMTQATAGDTAAYQRLMTELAAVVDSYLRSRFGSAAFVEDCVQESLLSVHRARESYDPRRPFRAWLFAIVRHKAIDQLRRQEARVRIEGRSAEERASEATSTERDPSAPHDAASLLDRLEPKYREALELTKLEGHSLEEAGRRTGISAGAMKTRVHRAIRTIRAALAEEERR
jgi:RNA polymerase sigma-70 factor (ECF subfamily)